MRLLISGILNLAGFVALIAIVATRAAPYPWGGVMAVPRLLLALVVLLDVYLIFRWGWRVVNGPVGASPLVPGERPTSAADEKTIEQVRRQVHGPALGLLITGILNLVAYVVLVALGAGYMPLVPLIAVAVPVLLDLVVMILAARNMKRLKAYPLAIIASILAMLIFPGNVIGLPIGIWSLIVLSRPDVRAAFGRPLRSPTARETKLGITAFILSLSRSRSPCWSGSCLRLLRRTTPAGLRRLPGLRRSFWSKSPL